MSKEAIDYLLFKEKFLAVDLFSSAYRESEFEYLYNLEDEAYEIEVERLIKEDAERYFWREDYLDSESLLDDEISIMKDGEVISIDLHEFLHGNCDAFAIALSKQFGYKICGAFSYDWDTGKYDYLIHAFCLDQYGRSVDIRGVREEDSDLDILSDFDEEGAKNVDFQHFSTDEAIKFFKNFISGVSYGEKELEKANQIIELFLEKYYKE